MPTLNWIGKEQIINHHNDVPFRVLERKYSFGDCRDAARHVPTDTAQTDTTTNKIIHGDNLEALKALLPEYEGRIKCIYIDPPYNTGNENWVYNDNVNSPKIRKWLGQVVGKESEDLSRHDKWLCMMYPRLVLLQKLLSDDGAIFISIDDNEQANLKLICDEIFGANNFVGEFIWKSTPGSNTGNDIKIVTEYISMYRKSSFVANTKKIDDDTKYNLVDEYFERRGKYILNKLDRRMTGGHYSDALNYQIEMPDSTLLFPGSSEKKQEHWNWRWSKSKVEWGIKNGFIVFKKSKNIWSIYFKQYSKVNNNDEIIERALPYQNLLENESFNSARGTADLMKIFEAKMFDYPKPISLIEEVLQIASTPDSIILDSFAGSGTTAHAVLNLNKADGGNRKFILVEMEDYAETITAERVKRVIDGYGDTEGTGGSFDFYELGEPVFDADGNLNENIGTEKIREYIWYSEIGVQAARLPNIADDANCRDAARHVPTVDVASPYLLGNHLGTAYYFYYEKDQITTLDKAFLNTITQRAEQYVIYADNCLLSAEFMQANHIIFKKIPRDIKKL